MNINPYETPPSLNDASEDATPESVDCWRDDDSLVLSAQSVLPNVCVYCCGKMPQPVKCRLRVSSSRLTISLVVIAVFAIAFILHNGFAWPVGVDPTNGILLLLLIVSVFFVWRFAAHERRYPTLQTQIPICKRHRWMKTLPDVMSAFLITVVGLNYFDLIPNTIFDDYFIVFFALMVLASLFSPTHFSAHQHRNGVFWIRGCSKNFLKLLPTWTNS